MARQKRIVGFPKDKLDSFLLVAKRLFDALHLGPCSRDAIADVLGASCKSGTFGTKLGTLLSFGLLDYSDGKYSVSKQVENYFVPIDSKSKFEALKYFVLCPTYYNEIYHRFMGKPLPTSLQNFIAQEKGIVSSRAEVYAEAIRDNFEFAGLLKNGIVQNPDEFKPGTENIAGDRSNEDAGNSDSKDSMVGFPPSNTDSMPLVKGIKRATWPLDETDGVVLVEWPREITTEDYRDISDWIEILKRKIKRSIVTNAGSDTDKIGDTTGDINEN